MNTKSIVTRTLKISSLLIFLISAPLLPHNTLKPSSRDFTQNSITQETSPTKNCAQPRTLETSITKNCAQPVKREKSSATPVPQQNTLISENKKSTATNQQIAPPIKQQLKEPATLIDTPDTACTKTKINEQKTINATTSNISKTSSDNHIDIAHATTKKTITIHNNITPTMLKYKHWTGTYKPTKFVITANGVPIKKNQTTTIPANNNSLTMRYEYEFMNGMRTGDKEVVFALEESTQTINLTFSWKNDSRFILDQQADISQKTDINWQA